jgi:DNA-directed RNA polymerase subunit RPC12/RpoP
MTRDVVKVKHTDIACLTCNSCNSIFTEDQVEEYWANNSKEEGVPANRSTCESCGQSLSDGVLIDRWEHGNNAEAYVKCEYCGHKNILYGWGGD